jgi:FMN phosphatase YigB (HAD superfamily)
VRRPTDQVFFEQLDEKVIWRSARSLIEASEKELWTKWLPNYLEDNRSVWEAHAFVAGPRWAARARPDIVTVIQLHRRGYIWGLLPAILKLRSRGETDGLTQYFKAVVLSSKVGFRKPDPEIYWEAARRVGVEPARCAYVGDNPVRDVEGTQRAGFGMMIILLEFTACPRLPAASET